MSMIDQHVYCVLWQLRQIFMHLKVLYWH